MARIILNNNNISTKTELNSSFVKNSGLIREKDLLKSRSKKYVDLIKNVDVKDFKDVRNWNKLIDDIKEEFGTAEIADILLGYVAKCFLGHPFEVHILDLSLNEIIKHYPVNEAMPPEYERARKLAVHHSYAFVEVYKNKLILINEDGSATEI